MTNIPVNNAVINLESMYEHAKTRAQRELLGYIVKYGHTYDTAHIGAFNALCEIERCMSSKEVYILTPGEDINIANQIGDVIEQALQGAYRRYAFTRREIRNILREIKRGE